MTIKVPLCIYDAKLKFLLYTKIIAVILYNHSPLTLKIELRLITFDLKNTIELFYLFLIKKCTILYLTVL